MWRAVVVGRGDGGRCRRLIRLLKSSTAVSPPPPPPPSVTAAAARKAQKEGGALDLSAFPPERIRNFSIIAHIDHGKSTIADRLLEYTGTIRANSGKKQVLDKLQVEQERGITVKAQTATAFYTYEGKEYALNLIDTPGHVDFNYEVRCSLEACQGTLLVVDASQGVQAQTLANFYLAFERELKILPVINKIDLPFAEVDRVLLQLESLFDLVPEEAVLMSAKTGQNIDKLLNAIVTRVPCPQADAKAPLRALLFDSWFDGYRGVISLIEILDGHIAAGDRIVSANSGREFEVQEVGIMYPEQLPTVALEAGQVGYVICGMKKRDEARVGDTFFRKGFPTPAMPGFQDAKAMVFAGLYPMDQGDYESLATAVERLVMNDPSVTVKRDVSAALGPGWRLGFLGMLHMEVFSQRLEQEHDVQTILTSPSVSFRATLRNNTVINMESPSSFPEVHEIKKLEEPMVLGTLVFPAEYVGDLMSLCEERRGQQLDMRYLDDSRVTLKYKLPLSEVVEDFYDRVKSLSSGYATFDYEEADYEEAKLVRLQILLNGEPVDALSSIVHSSRAYVRGKAVCTRLKENIPRQLYDIAIQAVSQSRVVARETVKAVRKDVTAKCYGGDITRKKKLLSRQKEGKKKMRMVGSVQLPKEAFLTVLSSADKGGKKKK